MNVGKIGKVAQDRWVRVVDERKNCSSIFKLLFCGRPGFSGISTEHMNIFSLWGAKRIFFQYGKHLL